jgi:NADPH2:quinone reductase
VKYGGFNYADIMMRKGIYPHPKGYPHVAGIEMAGTISTVGPGVTGLVPGDRVAAFCENAGAFAQKCVISSKQIVKVPDKIGLDTAAACLVQATTAWHLLHSVSTTKPGDLILVHAVGGGVGLYLTQIAVQAGAIVIGTVGTKGKEKRALEFGALRVINREDENFVSAVMDATKGRLIDKVIDSTGGSILDRSFETIRELGHVVSFGEAEGVPFANLWERLVRKSLTFTRLHIGHIDSTSNAWRVANESVFTMILNGLIKVPIEGIFSMDDVHEMYQKLESRTVAGKLLLRVS